MKKIYTLFLLGFGSLIQVNAQCVPVEPQSATGAYPAVLELACENRAYSDTLTVAVATSITVPAIPVPVTVDSVTIDSISDLPPGGDYDCHNGDCVIRNTGGDFMYGCIRLYGTPTLDGTFPMEVHYTAYAAGLGFPASVPTAVEIQDEASLACVFTSQDELIAKEKLGFYPNPAHGKISFEKVINEIKIVDLSGKTLLSDENRNELDISSLPSGLYQLHLDGVAQNLLVE